MRFRGMDCQGGEPGYQARQFDFHIHKLTRQRKAEAFPSLEAARQYVDALDSVFAHCQRHARTHKAVPGSAVEHKVDVTGDCDALFAANFERIETHRSWNGGYALEDLPRTAIDRQHQLFRPRPIEISIVRMNL